MEKNLKKHRKFRCQLEIMRPAAGKDHIPTPISPYKTRVKCSSLFLTTPLGRNALFWMPPKHTQKTDAFFKRPKRRGQTTCFAAPNAPRRPEVLVFYGKYAPTQQIPLVLPHQTHVGLQKCLFLRQNLWKNTKILIRGF